MKAHTIGIDFDNTIVSYDSLAVKLFKELHPRDPVQLTGKTSVRDYLRSFGKEDLWTEMQGALYGSRIVEAKSYDGFIDFLKQQKAAGSRLYIVSHKTKVPFKGPLFDLHESAWNWLKTHDVLDYINPEDVFFEETKAAKLSRIGRQACTHFIDDLVEILTDAQFPDNVIPILFSHPQDGRANQSLPSRLHTISSWAEASRLII